MSPITGLTSHSFLALNFPPPPHHSGAAALLTEAKSVVIVPGFGMAVANAQHMVASLVKELEKAGVKVKMEWGRRTCVVLSG